MHHDQYLMNCGQIYPGTSFAHWRERVLWGRWGRRGFLMLWYAEHHIWWHLLQNLNCKTNLSVLHYDYKFITKDTPITSDLDCRGASMETTFFVSGRSLGSYWRHWEANSTRAVASSVENFPSRCESINTNTSLVRINSRACQTQSFQFHLTK